MMKNAQQPIVPNYADVFVDWFCTPVGSRTPIVGTGIRNSIH